MSFNQQKLEHKLGNATFPCYLDDRGYFLTMITKKKTYGHVHLVKGPCLPLCLWKAINECTFTRVENINIQCNYKTHQVIVTNNIFYFFSLFSWLAVNFKKSICSLRNRCRLLLRLLNLVQGHFIRAFRATLVC